MLFPRIRAFCRRGGTARRQRQHRIRRYLPPRRGNTSRWTDRYAAGADRGRPAAGHAARLTERLRADAERAAAQQINHRFEREKLLNEQRQRFINFAAHEFKNPLTAIRSSNSILLEYGERMTEAARRKHHEQIEAQVQRMLDLINDMLSVGRLSEGSVSLDLKRIDSRGSCAP